MHTLHMVTIKPMKFDGASILFLTLYYNRIYQKGVELAYYIDRTLNIIVQTIDLAKCYTTTHVISIECQIKYQCMLLLLFFLLSFFLPFVGLHFYFILNVERQLNPNSMKILKHFCIVCLLLACFIVSSIKKNSILICRYWRLWKTIKREKLPKINV